MLGARNGDWCNYRIGDHVPATAASTAGHVQPAGAPPPQASKPDFGHPNLLIVSLQNLEDGPPRLLDCSSNVKQLISGILKIQTGPALAGGSTDRQRSMLPRAPMAFCYE